MKENIKQRLLEEITSSMPQTEENLAFCEKLDDGFVDMLDHCMAIIEEELLNAWEE